MPFTQFLSNFKNPVIWLPGTCPRMPGHAYLKSMKQGCSMIGYPHDKYKPHTKTNFWAIALIILSYFRYTQPCMNTSIYYFYGCLFTNKKSISYHNSLLRYLNQGQVFFRHDVCHGSQDFPFWLSKDKAFEKIQNTPLWGDFCPGLGKNKYFAKITLLLWKYRAKNRKTNDQLLWKTRTNGQANR